MALPTIAGKKRIGVRHRFSSGFTYLALLITIATMGGVLVAAGEIASHVAQREKEAELLFIGNQYRQAIASYYERSPNGVKRYPQKIEDVLEDKRFPMARRHLRKPYPDPITGQPLALMEAPGGGFMGVYSPSEAAPLKSGNFRKEDEKLAEAGQYADWKFFYQPPLDPTIPPPSPDGLSASSPRNNTRNTAR